MKIEETSAPLDNEGIVWVDPERMSGTPCFKGTRVPIQHLLDYLEGGDSIGEFLEGFPGVTMEQVVSILRRARDREIAEAEAALDAQTREVLDQQRERFRRLEAERTKERAHARAS